MNCVVYVKFHGFLINIDRGTARLLRLVRYRSAALGIIHEDTPFLAPGVRSSVLYILAALGFACLVARMRRLLRQKVEGVWLPDAGEIAIPCFPNGVRLFDLESGKVSNLPGTAGGVDTDRQAMIIATQEILGELGIAPRILKKGGPGEAYVEEFCVSTPLKSRPWWTRQYFEKVSGGVQQIQAARPTTNRTPGSILQELNICIDQLVHQYPDATAKPALDWLRDQILRLNKTIVPKGTVECSLSHGDLARRNILVRGDHSVVFIDWQTVDYRTRQYDIYNYHFSIIQDGCAGKLSETRVYQYLLESLTDSGTEREKALWLFEMDFLLTRLRHFVLAGEPDGARLLKVVRQMQDYEKCIRRFDRYRRNAQRC